MKNQIIIHASGKQTRIALIENGELAQFFIESPENQRTVGDIYLAEVHKVMSGIRAAFIDMGTPKDAFLHFSDVGDHLEDYIIELNGKDAIPQQKKSNSKKSGDNKSSDKLSPGLEKQLHAGEILAPGQKLLVQIVKEPIGSKGPRVSTDITLAGRFLVLVPMGDYIGVSKRIRSYKERRRLRNLVASSIPKGFGVIVRTVANGQPDEIIKKDLEDLIDKWNNVQARLKNATPPALLYRDLDMTESLIRDFFAKDYERLLIDDNKMYKSIRSYVSRVAPNMLKNIELYKGKEHVFDYMKIAQDVESVFSPRVKIPSGGYLIFEQTEAMYVIDVNSGRYAAKKHQEDNSLRTNLEAAREIAKQLRLRDIGGIIVVDFIDLREDVNRKKVYDELKKEFKKDRAKTNILQMSDFGLVQITRQRIRPSVVNSVSRICPMCGGSGSVLSQNTIISDIEAWLTKFKHSTRYRTVDLYINPYLKSFITRGLISQQAKWMMKFGIKISLIGDETVSLNDYKFTLGGSDVDITEAVLMDQPIAEAIRIAHEHISNMESAQKTDKSKLDLYVNRDTKAKGTHRNKKTYFEDVEEMETVPKKSNGNYKKENYSAKGKEKKDKEPKSQSPKSEDRNSSRHGSTRRSGQISKYYKDDNGASGKKSNASSPEKSSSESQNPAESKNPAGVDPTEEQPRNAWDVAREYHRKKLEEEGNAVPDSNGQDNPEHVENGNKKVRSEDPDDVTGKKKKAPAKTPTKKKTAAKSQANGKKETATKGEKATRAKAKSAKSNEKKAVKETKGVDKKPAAKKTANTRKPKTSPKKPTSTGKKANPGEQSEGTVGTESESMPGAADSGSGS